MSQIDVLIEIFANILLPYKDIVGQTAVWLGIFQIVSPALVLNGIRKSKSPNQIPIIPFLFVAVFTILNVLYSKILNDEALYNSNLVGFTMGFLYLTTYYYLSPSKEKMQNLISIASGCVFVGGVYLYSQYEDQSKLPQRFELILTSLLWSFYFLSALGAINAFSEKSTSQLPFEMVLGGAMMGVNRFCYGVLTNNKFIVIQYMIFITINSLQLLAFLLFSSETKSSEKKEKSKSKKKRE